MKTPDNDPKHPSRLYRTGLMMLFTATDGDGSDQDVKQNYGAGYFWSVDYDLETDIAYTYYCGPDVAFEA